MKGVTILFAAVILAIAVSGISQTGGHDSAETIREYILRMEGDTICYRFGEIIGSAPIDFSAGIDTNNITCDFDFILYSTIDTVIIPPTTEPARVFFVTSQDTSVQVFIFHEGLNQQYEAKRRVLSRFASFGNSPITGFKPFYYSGPDDTDLVTLREKYNLDSVAGDGAQIDRIINLMWWAHNIVRHDGNSANPSPANALNLISVCREEDRGVNCRMMATILNEVCLSMGFPSRHVTCFPADTTDPDCHVINMVYSDSLGKWLYMDPTFAGYFTDRDGRLLSIAEVRQMMINGDSLVINDDINWNGSPKLKIEYKAYMAKNLFRFCCPLGSQFGYESRQDSNRVWIYLDPVDYYPDRIGRCDTLGTEFPKLLKYYTDNFKYFWASPY
nr:transglutaminase domain-containing protein [candidate division Zixibacteria bacterium]